MANYYQYDYEAQQKEKEYKPVKLQTDRQIWKLIIFTVLTLGLYSIAFFTPLSYDLDKVDPKRGREKTMSFMLAYILSLFTLSIVLTVWFYKLAGHIEEALSRRKIDYAFDTGDFWKWYFFGSLILIGPFIYYHKICKAMNLLCQSYNEKPVLDE